MELVNPVMLGWGVLFFRKMTGTSSRQQKLDFRWISLTRFPGLQRLFDNDFVIFQLFHFFLKISLTTKSFYPPTFISQCDWVNRLILVCWFSLPAQFHLNFVTFSLLSSICRRLWLYQVGDFTTIYHISCIA
jgi:hypothetical protein